MKINIFDSCFSHLTYSIPNRNSEYIKYERNKLIYKGITIFTDNYLSNPIVRLVISKYKIAWILEPRSIHPHVYRKIIELDKWYDFVLTHDKSLLDHNPEKYKFCPVGGCWITDENCRIHEKNKLISMIYSNKTSTKGHRLRHHIANNNYSIDLFGKGTNKILKNKEDGLIDYMFSVAVENSSVPNYFTEKLIDCIAVGSVPIYWGCTNIGDFFDDRGIISFNDTDDLSQIQKELDEKKYNSMLPYLKKNLLLLEDYKLTEDWIYKHFFKYL